MLYKSDRYKPCSVHNHSQEITKRAAHVIFPFGKSSWENEDSERICHQRGHPNLPSFDSRALNDYCMGWHVPIQMDHELVKFYSFVDIILRMIGESHLSCCFSIR